MTTLHELIHDSASTRERELSGIGRPSLHGRARRVRVVRHARIGAGAAVGAGALAVGVALVVPVIGSHNTAAIGTLTPAGSASLPLAADGSLLSVIPANNVVVDLYLDPMCPICAEFAHLIGPSLLALDGATVVYHPISILDRASSDGSYSTRASSAIQEVAAGAPNTLGAFLDQLWTNQPTEGSGTLTDEQLVGLATVAGVPSDVSATFGLHRYADAVAAATVAATAAGLQGVPTIYIDGSEYVATSTPAWGTLVQQIQQAVIMKGSMGQQTPQSPSPTPSPVGVDAPASANSSASRAPSASPAATPSQTP